MSEGSESSSSNNGAASSSGSNGNIVVIDYGLLVCGCIAISFQFLRVSIDLIQTASQKTSADYKEDHHGKFDSNNSNNKGNNNKKKKSQSKDNKDAESADVSSSVASSVASSSENNNLVAVAPAKETDSLLALTTSSTVMDSTQTADAADDDDDSRRPHFRASIWSFRLQLILALIVLLTAILYPYHHHAKDDEGSSSSEDNNVIAPAGLWSAFCLFTLGAFLTRRDLDRHRFGFVSRVLLILAALSLFIPICVRYYKYRHLTTMADETLWTCISIYTIVGFVECLFTGKPSNNKNSNNNAVTTAASQASSNIKKRKLSKAAILALLKPYFWPNETPGQPWIHGNRVRAIVTWVCVIFSKVCNLSSPLFLGWASTALAHQDWKLTILYSWLYAMIQFVGSTFKEGQSLVYLKVAQAAKCQLSETAFVHLHNLSLDWHLQKKLGEVLRSMDRGIDACDTLMKYLFLWLIPGLLECFVVCIIFATYFNYLPMAVSVFYFVWLYIVWTILVTLWRKKFRKAVVKSDNEWHDNVTDSLINFETVKHFTAENYERRRFADSIQRYTQGSVHVQASLSFLNISQKLILQTCLATALSLSAIGIKQRVDCCIEIDGCPNSAVSDCCRDSDCPGMEVGDFVAVLTYTIQLFAPLNFLGSVYNAIVMAIIDLTNLSELLAEDPDVVDSPNAIPLPPLNPDDDDDDDDGIAVEFDNVYFHYPSQNSTKGLKGVSFKMKRGTTTAIVGPTGAGKTTISRLFFRFYDVLSGSVKVNGYDVRQITQQSLRGSIGVVPQTASMFNDTLRSNLRYGRRDATQEEIEQAAKDAQLLPFIKHLQQGWDTVVGDRGLKLSGGEKQRAAIARCLLKDPPFVLLDEATSALDTITEKSVQEALDRLGSHRTVLVIAHRLGTIRNADNILVLKDGVVAEEGTHDELLELNGLYADMWNMQLNASTNNSRASLTSGISMEEK